MKTIRLLAVLAVCAAPSAAQVCASGPSERRIVSCRDGVSLDECRTSALRGACRLVRDLPLIRAVVVEVPAARAFAAEAALARAPEVERVDADRKVAWLRDVDLGVPAAGELTRRLRQLRTLFPLPAAPRLPWGVERVGAPKAWPRTRGEGATVAVIDTGVDGSHPDLQGRVADGVNLLDPAKARDWADDEGHGTHVAGTIAAAGDGGGVAGVAPRAKILAVKVLDKDGNGNYSDVIAGIEWAVAHGAKIANMSLGADEGSEPLHRAVQAALAAGMTIVAAAGNSGGPVGYPGAYPETIAVAASDRLDRAPAFSSRGREVAFIAPGVDILSTKMGGGYATLSGTSMASPHVSGLAALALASGASSPALVRAALEKAAHPLPGLSRDVEGRGLVLAGDLVPGAGRATF